MFMLALLFSSYSFSQSKILGTAEIINVQLNLNSKWSTFLETQVRTDKLLKDFNYTEFKFGASYNFNNKIAFLVGNGFYDTYPASGNFEKPRISHEYRVWEQFVVYNIIGRLKLEHRYRIEQRWLNIGFRNRFRYRLNAIVTLNKPKVEKGALYAYLNDEVFFLDRDPYFQRNRFYFGLGYRFIRQFTMQVGYVHQFDYRPNASFIKNSLQTTLLFNIHGLRSVREPHPATMD